MCNPKTSDSENIGESTRNALVENHTTVQVELNFSTTSWVNVELSRKVSVKKQLVLYG